MCLPRLRCARRPADHAPEETRRVPSDLPERALRPGSRPGIAPLGSPPDPRSISRDLRKQYRPRASGTISRDGFAEKRLRELSAGGSATRHRSEKSLRKYRSGWLAGCRLVYFAWTPWFLLPLLVAREATANPRLEGTNPPRSPGTGRCMGIVTELSSGNRPGRQAGGEVPTGGLMRQTPPAVEMGAREINRP